ncbi:hypothetical protein Mapa_013765 [Marchantia paleacea]|nr:hypothetical protein Mapa_013765 [Marchantia paleacea]
MSLSTCLVAPRSLPCNLQKESTQRSLWVLDRNCSLVSTKIYALRSDSGKISTLHYPLSFRESVDLHRQHRICRPVSVKVHCSGDSGLEHTFHEINDSIRTRTRSWGLLRIGALIGSATVLSKILGLARETVLAAIYGVGPVMNAYSYASVVPGFFLALLGGINGPFHSAVAASLRSREEGAHLIQGVTAVTVVVGGALSLAIVFCAAPLLDVLAPGLIVSGSPGNVTRDLAVLQLKIMAPCAVLAALIGIGFGSLSTVGVYGLPSLSPALSSISIMSAVAVGALMIKRSSMSNLFSGSVALAAGTTFGALAQWGLQAVALRRTVYGPTQVLGGPKTIFEDEGVREVFSVLLPAAVSSGLLQIATFTDLYFASFIPGAAAGLNCECEPSRPGPAGNSFKRYTGSNATHVFSPVKNKLELQERVKQGLLLSMVMTFFMIAMLVSLAEPFVRIVFQRRAFDASASKLVSSLLICYSVGCTFSLARDLLVRVFYSLGDSRIPFQISAAAISANVLLDWMAVRQVGLGVQGLVLATSFVNCASAVALLLLLSSNLEGLKLRHWVQPLSILGFSATLAGIVAKVSYDELLVKLVAILHAANERSLWLADVTSVILAGGIGVISYFLPLIVFRIPHMEDVLKLLKAKL